jgi:hypothetical protein
MISRGVTCDADNQLTSVLQRKHPHELLDSVVKERWVKSFSSQPRRAFYSVLCICQAVIFRSFQSFLCNFNHLRFVRLASHVSGRRILQRYNLLSTAFSPLSIQASEPKRFLAAYFVQLFDFQGVFRFVCAGSGANYREIQRPVNT